MRAWKRLLIIVPAGLTLGAIAGQYAHPVLATRDDGSSSSIFKSRAEREGLPPGSEPAVDVQPYVGGYSYPPYLDDTSETAIQGPDFADWPKYTPARMPTIDELEAQLAARDAALGKRADSGGDLTADSPAEIAGNAADDTAGNVQLAENDPSTSEAAATTARMPPAQPSAEPRSADGALPAIW